MVFQVRALTIIPTTVLELWKWRFDTNRAPWYVSGVPSSGGCLLKQYSGRRAADGSAIVTRADGTDLPLRLDLYNHSPTGFEWGYGGSGPA